MAISLSIPRHCWVIWLVLVGVAQANPLDESYVQNITITAPSPSKTPPFGLDPWATAPSLQKTPNPIGRGLFDFYGCITCHNLPIAPFADRRGPDLDRIGDKTHPAWLSQWLQDPKTVLPNTRMPHIPLTATERDTLVHFLMNQRGKTPLSIPQKGNAIRGQKLFEDAQCDRCHRPNHAIGPALKNIGGKIRTPWLVAYLIRPADLVPNARMPDYEFSRTQAQDLTAFLLEAPSDPSGFSFPSGQNRNQQYTPDGLSLFVRKGCAGCHRIGIFHRPLSIPDPEETGVFVNHHQTRHDHSPHISLAMVRSFFAKQAI